MPAALIGVDLDTLLHRAHRMAEACAACVPAPEIPARLARRDPGRGALAGRDKVTFVLSPGIASFGLVGGAADRREHRQGRKGILPVADEPLGAPDVYSADRVFVSMRLAGEADAESRTRLADWSAAGHRSSICGWTTATTWGRSFSAGSSPPRWRVRCSGINPFDQPNVAESKANTKAVLARRGPPSPAASAAELEKFLAGIQPGDYLAIMAYLPPTPENDRRLAAIRLRLRDRLKVATTLGYGPRFLHSTGQLHKGGPPIGHFLQITQPSPEELADPR